MNAKVKIYPEGRESWLMFDSVYERDHYVNKEFQYCSKEEEQLLEARKKDDRDRAKTNLLNKRVEFAKKQGFQAKGNNIWERIQ